MPDYNEGKIYKIIAETNEDFLPYIGSSTQKLSKRMSQHRDNYKLFLEGKDRIRSKACDLFQKFGVKNCRIVLIENFPCKTIEELTSRERYWYDNIKNCNYQKTQRTIEEIVEYSKIYHNEHKEQISEKKKIHYQANKEEILKKHKEKFECVCGAIICKYGKVEHERSRKHISFISQN
jgi:hypothetical protein